MVTDEKLNTWHAPLLSEAERRNRAIELRKHLEQEVREAEILVGILRRHLEAATRLLGELDDTLAGIHGGYK